MSKSEEPPITAEKVKEITDLAGVNNLNPEELEFLGCLSKFLVMHGIDQHGLGIESAIKVLGVCYRVQKIANIDTGAKGI